MQSSSSATSPPLRPSSSSSQSWDASHEAHAMLGGSSSSNARVLPSPPIASSSSSPPLFGAATGDHESFDDILANARRSTSANTVNSKSSSPLNPRSMSGRRSSASYVTRRASFTNILRIPSEESRALSMHIPPSAPSTRPSTPSSSFSSPAAPSLGSANTPHRASMILYRLAADELRSRSESSDTALLAPPRFRNSSHGGAPGQRDSVVSMSAMSISGDSMVSLSSDSKYPVTGTERGLVPYAYDPDEDGDPSLDYDDDEGEDWMFEDEFNESKWNEKLRPSTSTETSPNATPTPSLPNQPRKSTQNRPRLSWSSRGMMNTFGLVLLVIGLLSLFIVYPVVTISNDDGRSRRITNNPRINSTGQADGDGGDVAAIPNNKGKNGVVEIVHRRHSEADSSSSIINFDWEGFVQLINSNTRSTGDDQEPPRWLKTRFARHYD